MNDNDNVEGGGSVALIFLIPAYIIWIVMLILISELAIVPITGGGRLVRSIMGIIGLVGIVAMPIVMMRM